MRQVDHAHLRSQSGEDRVAHAHEFIIQSVVGKEQDRPWHRQVFVLAVRN